MSKSGGKRRGGEDEEERRSFYKLAFGNMHVVNEPVHITIPSSTTSGKVLSQGSLVWLSPAVFDLEYIYSRGARRFEVKGSSLMHLDDTFPALNRLEIYKEDAATFTSTVVPEGLLKDCLENGGKLSRENAVASVSFAKRGQTLLQESFSERVRELVFGKTELPSAKWASCNFSLSPDWSRVLDLKGGNEDCLYLTGPQGQPVIQQVAVETMEAKRLFSQPALCSPFLTKDPRTGQVFSLEMEWLKPTVARYTIKQDGREVCKFAARPNYLNRMGLTEDYLVVVLCPLRMKRLPEERNHVVLGTVECFQYEPEERTLFYVFDRHAQCLLCVFQHSACFSPTGVINCYHNNNALTLDMVVYEDAYGWQRFQRVEHLRERAMDQHMPMGVLKRFVLGDLRVEAARFDGSAGLLETFPWTVTHTLASNVDNVCFNWEMLAGLPVQYYYAQSIRREDKGKVGVWWNSLVKVDVLSGYVKTLWTRSRSYPGPPLFILQSELEEAEDLISSFPPTPESMRTVHVTTSPREADSLALEAAIQLFPHRYRQEQQGLLVTVTLDTTTLKSSVVFVRPADGEEVRRVELPEMTAPMKSNAQMVWMPSAAARKRMARVTRAAIGAPIEVSTPSYRKQTAPQELFMQTTTPQKD